MKTKICKYVNGNGEVYYEAKYSYVADWWPYWLVWDWYTVTYLYINMRYGTIEDAKNALKTIANNYRKQDFHRTNCVEEDM